MKGHTIESLRNGYAKGEYSPQEIFDSYIKKIKKENPKLNAYLSVFTSAVGMASEGPRRVAGEESEQKSQQTFYARPMMPSDKALFGIPCAIKDNILIEDTVTTAGSKILENYRAAYDATVIKKLKSAGATFLGKTNCDEFAMGTSTENSAFGPTRNPHNLERVPGGSSGGSAAAIAADLAVFALGSDTGGSVRQPAAMCGIVGIKPTYGRVSRHGLIAMASSFDQIGVLAKNVSDSAQVLEIISGHDLFDSTTVDLDVPNWSQNLDRDMKGLRIGVPKEFFREGLSFEVEEKIRHCISKLEKMGHKIKEVSLPNFDYALAAYYILVPSEVSSNLARFDGIRYGHSTTKAMDLAETYFFSLAEGFGPESKRRIMLGTYALSAGYYDAYYLKAQKVRALIRKDFDDAFVEVDVIVGPTAPSTAFKIGEKSDDPLALYLEDIYTVPINLAGLPALSLPCGLGSKSNMPVGFHIIGKAFDEETILRVGHQLEQNI